MKKILFIHQSSELYGSDKTLLLLLQNINRKLIFPVVLLPTNGPLKDELEKLQITVIIAPVLKIYRDIFSFRNALNFFKDFSKGMAIIQKLNDLHNFDVVYSNTLAVLLGAFFSKKKKIKHIWHVHEIIEQPKVIAWLFPKMLYFLSDLIICNSVSTKNNIIERESGNLKKIIVVYNGIPIHKSNSSSKKSDFGFRNDDILITLVGRISRLKGHQLILEAFGDYLKINGHVKLLFVGSPLPNQEQYLNNINTFIKEKQLLTSIKIIPFSQNLSAIWNVTDIAIMPSTEKESFGLVAAEAMMAKKPVVAANHGGLTEIIVNNETGFLVEPNNKIALKEALEKLINDAALRKVFGENGFARSTANFSIGNYVKKIEDALQSI